MSVVQHEHAMRDFHMWMAAFDRDPIDPSGLGVWRHRISRPVQDAEHVIVELEVDTRAEAEACVAALQALQRSSAAAPALLGSRTSAPSTWSWTRRAPSDEPALVGAVRPGWAGMIASALVALLVSIFLVPGGAQAAPTWGAMPDTAVGKPIIGAAVDVDPAGVVTVAFTRSGGVEGQYIEAVRRAPGGAWSTPQRISVPSAPGETAAETSPRVAALPNGEVVVAYRRLNSLRTRTIAPDGTLGAQEIHTGTGLGEFELVSGPRGDLALVWAETPAGEKRVFMKVRPPGETGFLGVESVSEHDGGTDPTFDELSAAFDSDGNLYVAYLQDTQVTGGYQTRAKLLRRYANSIKSPDFTTSQIVDDPDNDALDVAVAVDGLDIAHAAWVEVGPAGGAARYLIVARAEGIGGPTDARQIAADGGGLFLRGLHVSPDGSEQFMWVTSGAGQVLKTRRRTVGHIFPGDVETLSDPDLFTQSAVLVGTGDGSIALWTESGAEDSRTYVAVREAGSDVYGAAERIVPGVGSIPLRAIADAAGNVTAVGFGASGLRPLLGDNDGGPDIGPLGAPAGGAIGETLAFSGSAADWSGIASLGWSFSDGASVAGAEATHSFGAAGAAAATLAAIDLVGRQSSATAPLTITAPPVGVTPPVLGSAITSFTRKRIRGTATAAAGVQVAVVRKRGRLCRHLRANGRVKRARCSKRVWLAAAIDGSAWNLRPKRKLPRGRYTAYVRAVAADGTVQAPPVSRKRRLR